MAWDAQDNFERRLEVFKKLNPDILGPEIAELRALAEQMPRESFPRFAAFAERIIQEYLASPWKTAERRTLEEYFEYLDRASRLLAEAGEMAAEPGSAPKGAQSVALVPRRLYSSLDWCKVLNRADVPRPVIRAVDAARRRNQLLTSVVEELLYLLQRIDLEACVAWETAFLEAHRGDLDPDLVRDFLRAWRREPQLPAAVLDWAFQWSGDKNLERQWPAVVREADLLLRKYAFRVWRRQPVSRNPNLTLLRRLLERKDAGDQHLSRWLETSITDIGASVQFFVTLSRKALGSSETPEDRAWQQAALLREIRKVESLFPPVLLLADLILSAPNGAYRFALAFFGLTGENRLAWERKVQEFAEEFLRRQFLDALRNSVKAIDVIRRFSFGDEDLFLRMVEHLDFATKEFDSLRERDKVVRELAVYYASYRGPELLAAEVGRRYRDLMRVLHEDNLRRLLSREQFEQVTGLDVLRDLASLAAEARRYLARRRALDTTLEQMAAAEMDFADGVRQRRLFLIRKLLLA